MGLVKIDSLVAFSASPARSQLQNQLSWLSFTNPIFPNYEQKVSNYRYLPFQKHCQRLHCVEHVFVNCPSKNEISLSSVIASHSRSGNFSEAFDLFKEMIGEGLQPGEFALAHLLRASCTLRNVSLSRQLHGWIVGAGFGSSTRVRKALVIMYSRCGLVDDARLVFDEIPLSYLDEEHIWKSIIVAYISTGCCIEAFQLFGKMLSTGLVTPTEHTYASILNACASRKEEKCGLVIHGIIEKYRLLEATSIWNSLVTFYVRCEKLEDANLLFERILRKDVVSWNAIIASNEQMGTEDNAIKLFRRMLGSGQVQPNRITFLSVLAAASRLLALNSGREIHGHIIRLGLEDDTTIANSLITLYSKCRKMDKVEVICERLHFKDIVTWNSLLSAYEQNNQQERCYETFKKMQHLGIEADSHSFTVIISAVWSNSPQTMHLRMGQEIHGYVLRRTTKGGLDLSVSNALITMYAKANRIVDAEKIFRATRKSDSYTWNAMMDGYTNNSQFEDAIMIFLDMMKKGYPISHLSFSIVITCCCKLVSLPLGKRFHSFIEKKVYDQGSAHKNSHLSISNSLISMYSKCGSINDATQIFTRMERRDVYSWTAMITGYAENGMASESLQLFERMKIDAMKPNQITFLGVLMACAHGGLVEKGIHYLYCMEKEYGLSPNIEHYACMVDLYGRLGKFDSAKELVESTIRVLEPYPVDTLNLWRVLLGSCHVHKKLELGIEIGRKIIELAPDDSSSHVIVSNLYATSGLWEDANMIRKAMIDKGLRKEVGCSWIDIGNKRHVFVAADSFHPLKKQIYRKLQDLDVMLRKMRYETNSD